MASMPNGTARVIVDLDISEPYKQMFDKLSWLPIPEKIRFRKTITVYKALNEHLPQYLNDFLNL